ncbi:MAG: DAK2 domain-containing protein [Erysipelotrichaceae bacterium]|nr:DAK2 domain-containing protein [Erysipelotrichaceae bacterium]
MNTLNGVTFRAMLESGCNNLNNRKAEIDALNVFPVPDGDTGTNMSMTFSNGVNEVMKGNATDLPTIAKTLSRGLLMGARGNSGVILSQIFRGFYQGIDGKEELDSKDLAEAFNRGTKVAYKAVMRPVEGTILTVIRESTDLASEYVDANPGISVEEYFDYLIKEAKHSLDTTPDLLPVLKEVGVVDSGGAGLLSVLEGFKAALEGHPIAALASEETKASEGVQADMENDEFGYCTEFIFRLNPDRLETFNEEKLRNRLAKIGNSLVVVQDEDIVKVHVHTLTPGEALNIAQRYGEFIKLKIENMQEQHTALVEEKAKAEAAKVEKKPEQEYAIITVAAGEGLKEIFKEYRCDVVISGGQTMNPSTEDFVEAINSLNAKHIIILPNNSNIIMAAKQAAIVLEDQDIHVLETKSINQGLSACLMFNPEADIEANIEDMNNGISSVKSGQVTYAIKDTSYEGLEIKEGDFMGIFEKAIVTNGKDKLEVVYHLLDKMIDEDSEIVTLIYGEGETKESCEPIVSYIEEKYDLEVDLQHGDQPVYNYFIGVE